MGARFITHLFGCPKYPPATTHLQAELPHFIAYVLHRTKLHTSVTFASLILLHKSPAFACVEAAPPVHPLKGQMFTFTVLSGLPVAVPSFLFGIPLLFCLFAVFVILSMCLLYLSIHSFHPFNHHASI